MGRGYTLISFSFGDRLVHTLVILETASILVLWCKLGVGGLTGATLGGGILAFNIMRRPFAIQKRVFYKSPTRHYPPCDVLGCQAGYNTSRYVLRGFVGSGNGWIADGFGI